MKTKPLTPDFIKAEKILAHREAQEKYEAAAGDPGEQLEAMILHEQISGTVLPPLKPVLDPKNQQWTLTIPSSTGGGTQVFRSMSLDGLAEKLGIAQWHCTRHVAHLNDLLKDKYTSDNSCYTICDSTGFSN